MSANPAPLEELAWRELLSQHTDGLAAALQTGPGRPGLHAAADVMGKEQNLATAVLMAPLAGLAAGLLRLTSRVKNAASKEDDHA